MRRVSSCFATASQSLSTHPRHVLTLVSCDLLVAFEDGEVALGAGDVPRRADE